MTETPGAPGTEIAKSVLAGTLAAVQPKATASSVLAAMVGAEMAEYVALFELQAMPPKAVVPSTEQVEALEQVADLVRSVAWPTSVRELTGGEQANLLAVRAELDKVDEFIDATKESIREAEFNSFDRVAEREGRVDESTPKDEKGHYVLADKESGAVPGCENKFVRETRRGTIDYGAKLFDGDLLLASFEKGQIDRKTYLRWTRATRVVDLESMFKDMQDPVMLAIIREIVNVGKPTASLNVRKNV